MSPNLTGQNLFYSYHWEWGHITEDCRTLKDHLNQLEKARQVKEFSSQDHPHRQEGRKASGSQATSTPIGIIEMIHAAKASCLLGQVTLWILTVAPTLKIYSESQPIKKPRWEDDFLEFSRKDREGTIQPYDDAQWPLESWILMWRK